MRGFLRRHRWALIAVAIVIAAGTVVLYLSISPRYSARASVWLDHRLDNDVSARGEDADRASVAARRNTELRFLTSPDIAARVVDKLGLASVRGIGQPDRRSATGTTDGRQRAITALVDGTSIKATGASYAVVVNFTGIDPVVATAVVNQIVDQYVTFRREAEQRDGAVAQLRAEIAEARVERIRTAAAANAFRVAVRAFGDDGRSRRLRAEIARLPREVRTADELNGLGAADAATSRRLAQLRALAGQMAREDTSIRRRNERRQAALDAAADTARRRHVALEADLRRVMATRPQSAGAYVIARAAVPRTSDFPQPWVIALGGLVAALAALVAAAVARQRLHSPVRARRQAERILGIPVIGVVPDTASVLDRRDAWITPIDLVVANNTSSFRAAFRTMLAGLGVGRGEESPRSIVVSSAVAEEGKTTVAIGLARSAALAGLRVLLIDCDLRLPAASRLLLRNHPVGLVDVLEGKAELRDAVVKDTAGGAWVLGTSQEGGVPDGLVSSEAMMNLIRQASGSYDLIVLDAAPALALAEVATLASFADLTLMIARWRTTPRQATRLAISTLRDAGAKVDALVLTRVGS